LFKPRGVTILINMNGLTLSQLTDVVFWKDVIMSLTRFAGLTPHTETFVFKRFKDAANEVCGITFSTILSESHIQGHTWGESNYLRLELSSCKYVSPDSIREWLESKFPDTYVDCMAVAW